MGKYITAKYKRKTVIGEWFCLGDNYWLLLSPESTKETGLEAISMDNLTKISRYPY